MGDGINYTTNFIINRSINANKIKLTLNMTDNQTDLGELTDPVYSIWTETAWEDTEAYKSWGLLYHPWLYNVTAAGTRLPRQTQFNKNNQDLFNSCYLWKSRSSTTGNADELNPWIKTLSDIDTHLVSILATQGFFETVNLQKLNLLSDLVVKGTIPRPYNIDYVSGNSLQFKYTHAEDTISPFYWIANPNDWSETLHWQGIQPESYYIRLRASTADTIELAVSSAKDRSFTVIADVSIKDKTSLNILACAGGGGVTLDRGAAGGGGAFGHFVLDFTKSRGFVISIGSYGDTAVPRYDTGGMKGGDTNLYYFNNTPERPSDLSSTATCYNLGGGLPGIAGAFLGAGGIASQELANPENVGCYKVFMRNGGNGTYKTDGTDAVTNRDSITYSMLYKDPTIASSLSGTLGAVEARSNQLLLNYGSWAGGCSLGPGGYYKRADDVAVFGYLGGGGMMAGPNNSGVYKYALGGRGYCAIFY